MQIWGMGIGSYDLTGDGYPEVYLTSQGPNKLQTLLTGPEVPTYRDIAIKHGVIATRPSAGGDPLPSTAWHPEFQDVNNDGFIDLFVSKGNVGQQPDYAAIDPSDLFMGAPDGTFTYGAEEAGIIDPERGRGAALADFNADGLLDLVQVDLDAPVRLWRNVGAGTDSDGVAMGHWLGLAVRQPGPNRDAIGAFLEVRVGEALQRRELTVGGGHVGGQLGWTHFGLARHRGPTCRSPGRTANSARGSVSTRISSRPSIATATRSSRGRHDDRRSRAGTGRPAARLSDVVLPDFGDRPSTRSSPRRPTPTALNACASAWPPTRSTASWSTRIASTAPTSPG